MTVTMSEALWFLPFIVPVCLFVAWSDMKFMRIPNKTVLLLVGVFAVVGLVALPLVDYAWRWVHLIVILLIGFIASSAGLVGAGDAKFAAAMAPFFAFGDAALVLMLFSAILLGAFVTHRIARAIPAVRRALPDWESWTRKRDFPMGLALSGTLMFYFLLPVILPGITLS
ncbi:prepilin peptidase [Tropicimonas sp. S265A]|uniref:prepilin peptidase n=1 Tax=Tropicimonas sp. S265A TaxID=3415134 RepID=UPI003C7B5EBC